MFGMLAVLDYLAALAIPVFLIRHFGAAHWFWHLVSIGAALTLGLMPLPIKGTGVDLAIGFVFIFLMTWGIGGLLPLPGHRERHA
jgi:hypothetical protein